MRMLTIESSLAGGSVAVFEASTLVAAAALSPDRRTAQTLLPAVRDILEHAGWRARDIELVAVTTGPGSFTSLRIGITAAKTFAYAARAELLGVPTLELLAAQVPPAPDRLWTVLHAERRQLFAATFRRDRGRWVESESVRIVGVPEWLEGLRPGDLVSGPALVDLHPMLPPGVTAAGCETWQPQAAAMGTLAWQRYTGGVRGGVWSLLPEYVRPSAAEEKAGPGPGEPSGGRVAGMRPPA